MVASEIGDFCIFCEQARDMLDNLHVRLWPKPFVELPHVDYVAIEYDPFGLDRFKIPKQLFRMTSIGTQMYVR